jgi:threonine aldolase
MWDAMVGAPAGWPHGGDDASVNALQALAAEMTGKEAALFVPTGTMANLLALMTHATRGDQVIAEASSHIFWSEEWGYAYVCGLAPRPVEGTRGRMAPEQVHDAITEEHLGHRPHTGLICLENTHNMAGGTIVTPDQTRALADVARAYGIPVHIDGARILNAAAGLGTPLSALVGASDSVAISLTKGLSAPYGAVLCGSADFVGRCTVNLKRLGGSSVHKAGIYAAAGLVALRTMGPQLADDNRRASALSRRVQELGLGTIQPWPVETNIVVLSIDRGWLPARTFARRLADAGVKVSVRTDDTVRLVTHRHITDQDVDRVVGIVGSVASTHEMHA